jgi:hypothetical protein
MENEPSRAARGERRSRARRRNPTYLAGPWIALVGPHHWAATVLDISATGLALLAARSYEAGHEMKVEFLDRANRTWHAKRVRVVHCTLQVKHVWMIGGEFVEPFTDEEFQALLPERQT